MNTRISAAHQRQQEAIERFVDTIYQVATDPEPGNQPLPCAPHCELPWPLLHSTKQEHRRAGQLIQASSATWTLSHLLLRDEQIVVDVACGNEDCRPFTPSVREGLLQALVIAVEKIQGIAEDLHNEAREESGE